MDKVRQLQKKYLQLILLVFVLGIALSILNFVFIKNDLKYLFIFIILLLVLVFTLRFKQKFDIYSFTYEYERLLSNIEPALSLDKKLFTHTWLNEIKQKNYALYKSFGFFQIYYKIEHSTIKKRKRKTLFLLILINDTSKKFEDPIIVKTINKFEDEIRKKNKYHQRIFIQIKQESHFTQKLAQETNNVFWFKHKGLNLVLLNATYFEEDNAIYFVHNNEYSPNQYYLKAIEELNSIL